MKIDSGLVVIVIGLLVALGAIIKLSVVGYYTSSEMLIWMAILLLGLGAAAFGSKLRKR